MKLDRLARALSYLEHVEIYNLVKLRGRRGSRHHISLDALLREEKLEIPTEPDQRRQAHGRAGGPGQ